MRRMIVLGGGTPLGRRVVASLRRHVEVDAGELGLMLEGLHLRGARRRKRWYRLPHQKKSHFVVDKKDVSGIITTR